MKVSRHLASWSVVSVILAMSGAVALYVGCANLPEEQAATEKPGGMPGMGSPVIAGDPSAANRAIDLRMVVDGGAVRPEHEDFLERLPTAPAPADHERSAGITLRGRVLPGGGSGGGGGGGVLSEQDNAKVILQQQSTGPEPVSPAGPPGADAWDRRNPAGGKQARLKDEFHAVRLPEIPGSLPSLDEEVWVIQRYRNPNPRPRQQQPQDDDVPGSGSLVCPQTQPDGSIKPVPVPLKHTDVHASVAGHIASVLVTQRYTNPFSSKIEAVYVFPLPENAAVSDFVMTIGDRHIRGIIRDRAEAEQIYTQARAQGYTASLMTQERPNIFTQKVANIEPGRNIDISITYFNTLQYIDGEFEFVMPMVVGPRFNPPVFYDGVGAAARNQPGSTAQATEVQYLRPNERSGHDIAVTLDIDAGVPIGRVYSNSHVVDVKRPGNLAAANDPSALSAQSHRATVTLSAGDSIPNKDLVVRWQVAGDRVRSGGVVCGEPSGDRFFNVMLVPPKEIAGLRRHPVEMIFVLDCSGSMAGRPIEQAVAAAERGLRRLEPSDTFQIINFSNSASQMGAAPVLASRANIERGIQYLKGLFAEGGTMMMNGIHASLAFPHDAERLRYVVFLTDAFIGNEQEILSAIHAELGDTRIFSFGVGTSTNRYLLDAMAKVGRGCVAHVAAGDNPVEIVDRFYDRISHPAMTDVSVEVIGAESAEVFPRQSADLYVGRVLTFSGRARAVSIARDEPMRVRVRGKVEGRPREFVVDLTPVDGTRPGSGAGALPRIWARQKIADMADHGSYSTLAQLGEQVKSVALTFGLLSAHTAFVAVDSTARTQGTLGTTVVVPVNMPEGVKYQTTVPEGRGGR